MFHCEDGHVTEPWDMLKTHPLEVRPVEYRLVNHKGHLLRASTGTEIVREGNFCPEHIEEAQNREPVLLDQDPKIVVSKI